MSNTNNLAALTAPLTIGTFATTKDAVRETEPVDPKLRSAFSGEVERLGRANWARAEAEILNEAMGRFIHLAYEKDETGYCNIDPKTNDILPCLPVPWSSKNFRRYGIRVRKRADVMRGIMMLRAQQGDALFLYIEPRQRWRLNRRDYLVPTMAMEWYRRYEITPQQYAVFADPRNSDTTRRYILEKEVRS